MRKHVYKCFLLPDYEKEEQYLTEMHRSGWRLVDARVFHYIFEQCEPEEVVYRLDYPEQNETWQKNDGAYQQMFADYGWEYLAQVNGFYYFRKPASTVYDADNEIFCDNSSRLTMIKRIINTRLLPIWIIFLCIVIPNVIRAVNSGFGDDVIGHAFCFFWGMMFGIYTYIFVRCFIGFRKLKQKYDT